MSRSKVHSSKYGYALHPQSSDTNCFWCHEPLTTHTYDYTPHRHIGCNDKIVEMHDLQRIAVRACTTCIGVTTVNKQKLLTISDKRAFFDLKVAAREKKAALLMEHSPLRPWQIRLETGEIVDVPDFDLDEFQLAAKNSYQGKIVLNTAPDQGGSSDSGAEIERNGDVQGASSVPAASNVTLDSNGEVDLGF